jgi:hypothetical protein
MADFKVDAGASRGCVILRDQNISLGLFDNALPSEYIK